MITKQALILLISSSFFSVHSSLRDLYEFDDMGPLPSTDSLAYVQALEWLTPLFAERLELGLPSPDYTKISTDGIILKTDKEGEKNTIVLFSPLYSVHFENKFHRANPLVEKELPIHILYEELSEGQKNSTLYAISLLIDPQKKIKIAFPVAQSKNPTEKDLCIVDTNQTTVDKRKTIVTRCKEALKNELWKEFIENQLVVRAIEIQKKQEEKKDKLKSSYEGAPIEIDEILLAEAREEEKHKESTLEKGYEKLKQSASDLMRVSSGLLSSYVYGSQEKIEIPQSSINEDDEWVDLGTEVVEDQI